MPVTKTAKRALRGSDRKRSINVSINTNLEKAIRTAKKSKSGKDIMHAMSLADRASKKQTIHENKASRIKSALSKLLKIEKKAPSAKKTSKKK